MPFFQKILFSKLVVLVFLLIAGSVSTSSNTFAQSSVYNQQRLQTDLIRRQQDALRRQQEEARRRAAAEERRRELQRQRRQQEEARQRQRRRADDQQRQRQSGTARRNRDQASQRLRLTAQQQARNALIQQQLKQRLQRGVTARSQRKKSQRSVANLFLRQGAQVRNQSAIRVDPRAAQALVTARRLARLQAERKQQAKSQSRLLLPAPSSDRRNSAGVASYGGTLPIVRVGDQWLKGGAAGKVPQQIASRLSGRKFRNFDAFRAAFWKEVSADRIISKQFSRENRNLMAKGQAPFSQESQQVGKRKRYELDHNQEIQHSGNVYDMNNIIIRSPLNHISGK